MRSVLHYPGLPFTLLLDREGRVERAGRTRGPATDGGSRRPHPTTYVIDRQGVVRWKFTEVNYKVRPTNDMILEAFRRLR